MKKLHKLLFLIACFVTGQVIFSLYCCTVPEQKANAASPAPMTKNEMIARGKNLVVIGGCNDCHSPKIMTPQGPVVDSTRPLSGSPADMKLPAIDLNQVAPGKWYLGSSDLTAWVGPWGISYAANLTPDTNTGTGGWTEEIFIRILRSGKFMGIDGGRPIMPPMPNAFLKVMSDDDLKCIFAYLHSLTPIKNRVHDYVPPTEIKNMM
jgi:Cytochrome c